MPLAVAFLLGTTGLYGCDKAEEIAGKVAGNEDKEADDKKADEKDGDASDDAAKDGEEDKADEKKEEPVAEPIPVEPLHTGLDLMLSFVPDTDAEYMLIRDASVIEEYYEEGMRFLDTPIEKLSAAKDLPSDFKDASTGFELARLKGKEVVAAMHSSGLRLKDGGALIKTKKGKSLLIFASDDPSAISKLATAMGLSLIHI